MESLECSKSGNCDMIPKSRKNCRKCRLERCHKAGMDPKLVMDEQAKKTRFRNVKSKKRPDSVSTKLVPSKSSSNAYDMTCSSSIVPKIESPPPDWIECINEKGEKHMNSDEYKLEVHIRSELVRILLTWKEHVASNFSLSSELTSALDISSSLNTHLSKGVIKSHLNAIQRLVIDWATTSTDFGSLLKSDQAVLARENGSLFSALVFGKSLGRSSPSQWLTLGHQDELLFEGNLDEVVRRSLASWRTEPTFQMWIDRVNGYEFTQQWQCIVAFGCLLNVQSQTTTSTFVPLQDSSRILNMLLDVLPLVQCLKWDETEFLNFLDTLKEFSAFLDDLDWNSSEISRFTSKTFTLDNQAQVCSMLCDVNNEWRHVNLGTCILREILMFGLNVPFSAEFMENASKRFQERFWRVFEYFPEFRDLSVNDKKLLVVHASPPALGVVNYWFDQMSSGQAQLSIIMGHEDKRTLEQENCVLSSITPKYYSLSQVLKFVDMENKKETLDLIAKGKLGLIHLIKDWSSFYLVLLFAMFMPAARHETLAKTAVGKLTNQFESILSQTCRNVPVKEHLSQIDHLATGINNILKLV